MKEYQNYDNNWVLKISMF